MNTYEVTVTREDNLWVADTHDLQVTDVEHFDDLNVEVRDLIAGLTDADPDDFNLTWHFEFNGYDVTSDIVSALEKELHLKKAERERDTERKRAITAMRRAGLSFRQIGEVLDISHQRAQQLDAGEPNNAAIRQRAKANAGSLRGLIRQGH